MAKSGAKKLGIEVRKRRLQKGMTQQQLASMVNVDPSYISKIELGLLNPDKQGPSEAVVHALAEALVLDNESVDELFSFFCIEYLNKLSKSTQQEVLKAITEKEYSRSDKPYYKYLGDQVRKLQTERKTSSIIFQNLAETSIGEEVKKQQLSIVDERDLPCTRDKIMMVKSKSIEEVLRAIADDLESTVDPGLKKIKEEMWMQFYMKKRENW